MVCNECRFDCLLAQLARMQGGLAQMRLHHSCDVAPACQRHERERGETKDLMWHHRRGVDPALMRSLAQSGGLAGPYPQGAPSVIGSGQAAQSSQAQLLASYQRAREQQQQQQQQQQQGGGSAAAWNAQRQSMYPSGGELLPPPSSCFSCVSQGRTATTESQCKFHVRINVLGAVSDPPQDWSELDELQDGSGGA